MTKPTLPPRPNPGPEPGPSDAWWPASPVLIGLALAFLLLLLAGLFWARHRRELPRPILPPGSEEGDPGPTASVLAWALQVREALADTFGTSWLSKSTEELLREPSLQRALDTGRLDGLARLLVEADRLQYAIGRSAPVEPADWEQSARDLIQALAETKRSGGPRSVPM